MSIPQKKNGTEIHKSLPRKVNNSLHSADVLSYRCKLAFLFHIGSSISPVKNNTPSYMEAYAESQVNTAIYMWPHYIVGSLMLFLGVLHIK